MKKLFYIKSFILSLFCHFIFHQQNFSQSVSLPTDRARIHVAQIVDPTDVTKTLKVLRTDANTPLRGASPWIIDKFTPATSNEISAAFFQEQANENLNSIRLIWFEAWMEGYPIQQGVAPYGNTTDFNNPTEVQHCLNVLETAVNNASANGMYVCINFHSPFKGPIHLSYAQAFWNVVAPYFANRTHVIYELGNEPVTSSGSFTAANDRGTDMSSQVTLYNLMKSKAPNTFNLIMTPPSCEGDFTTGNEFIQGVQRFESLVGTVDWTKTGVGYHTYYLGWNNSCNCAATTSVPLRAIHRAYPAFATETTFPAGAINSLNQGPSMDGELYQQQTLERLGLGWWSWAISHPDNSTEGWYANWPKIKNDAVAKGYFWGKDNATPSARTEAETNYTIVSDVGSNATVAPGNYGGTTCSNGNYLLIADPGDEASIAITAPSAGDYDVLVRVRSGWTGAPTYHVDNNFYEIRINGVLKTSPLVAGSVTSTIDVDSYYGTLKVSSVTLNAGVNYVRIKALNSWQKVDYVQANLLADAQAPTAPTAVTSSAIKSSRFNLSWTASTDNVGVTLYEIFNGSTSLGTTNTTSYSAISLTPGTAYSITIKAKDAIGNTSAASAVLNVTTLNSDATILNTTVAPVIDGTKESTWAGTNNNTANLVAGSVANSADLGGTWSALWDNTNLYLFADITDNTITVNGTNWYDNDRIEIFIDANGDRTSTYGANDFQYYILPGQTAISETKQNATANVQVSNITVTGGYRVELKIPFATLGITPAALNKLGIDVQVGDNDGGGTVKGKLAWYAIDDLAWSNPSLFGVAQLGAAATDIIAPGIPTGLVSSAITSTSFTLSWTASTDNVAVTGYEVFRNGISVGTTASTSISIIGLTSGVTYSMSVRARDAVPNWSAASAVLSVTTTDNIAPGIPTGLVSSAITTTSFTLSWTASTDNVGVTGYEVFRNGISIGTTASTSLSITGLTSGVNYSMTVRARDAVPNWSAASAALSVTTTDNVAPGIPTGLISSAITATSFTLSWTASTDNVGVTGYEVFRNGISIGTTASTSMSITGLTTGVNYSMTVRARDAVLNWSAASVALSVTTTDNVAPGIPTGLISSAITATSFTLSWTASSDNVGVTGYDVFRNGVLYSSVASTTASITGLTGGVTYQMTVRAKDAAGNTSALSTAHTVQTISNNILLNPGFENGTTSWTGQYGCTLTAGTIFRTGLKGGSVTARTNQYAGAEQTFTSSVANLGAGVYYMEAWARMVSGSSVVKATFKYRYNNTDYYVGVQGTVGTSWTKISGNVTIAYTGTLQFAQFYTETTSGTASFYLDDCIVTKVGQSTAARVANTVSLTPNVNVVEKGILVHPNPVTNSLNISNVEINSELVVYSVDGKIINKIKAVANVVSLNVSGYKKGLYVIKISNKNKTQIKKFLVK